MFGRKPTQVVPGADKANNYSVVPITKHSNIHFQTCTNYGTAVHNTNLKVIAHEHKIYRFLVKEIPNILDAKSCEVTGFQHLHSNNNEGPAAMAFQTNHLSLVL